MRLDPGEATLEQLGHVHAVTELHPAQHQPQYAGPPDQAQQPREAVGRFTGPGTVTEVACPGGRARPTGDGEDAGDHIEVTYRRSDRRRGSQLGDVEDAGLGRGDHVALQLDVDDQAGRPVREHRTERQMEHVECQTVPILRDVGHGQAPGQRHVHVVMLVVAGVARVVLVAGAAVRVLGVIAFVVLVPAMSGIPALVGRLTVAGMA